MKNSFTGTGRRWMHLLPLLLLFCAVGAMAHRDLALTETARVSPCPEDFNGSITFQISGGTAPYYFNGEGPSNSTSFTVTGLSAGEAMISVTDANECYAEVWVTIEAWDAPSLIVLSTTPITCYGFFDGTATVLAIGGNGPYQYSAWDINTTGIMTGMFPGENTIYVTDANGCSGHVDVTIEEPAEFLVSIVSVKDVSCYGGQDGEITLQGEGGTTPYQYSWSSTSGHFDGLFAGDYSFDVYDARGCWAFASAAIIQPEELVVDVSSTDVTCFGGTNGTATALARGGVEPYTYDWYDFTMGTSGDPGMLAAGDYYLTVTDGNGCNVFDYVTIAQPEELVVEKLGETDVSCSDSEDATVTLQASGGTGPYQYDYIAGTHWEPAVIGGLAPGLQVFYISDAHGCGTVFEHYVGFVLPMYVQAYTLDMCPPEIYVSVSEGAPNYTYSWAPGGWTTESVSNVPPGTYTVTVTDGHGCEATAVTTVEDMGCDDEFAIVPTAISADGDGENDTFRVLADNVGSVQLNVYDLFGQPVFSTTDVKTATETGWDGTCQGKHVPSGWYIWTLQGTHTDGRPLTAEGGQRGRLVLSR